MSQSAAPWQEGCTANSIIAKIFHRARNVLLPCWWKHEHTSGPQQLRQRPQITGPKISLVLLVLWQPPRQSEFQTEKGRVPPGSLNRTDSDFEGPGLASSDLHASAAVLNQSLTFIEHCLAFVLLQHRWIFPNPHKRLPRIKIKISVC